MGQLTPTDQRDILFYMMSFSAYKAGEEVLQGHVQSYGFMSSKVTVTCGGAWLYWKWPKTCLLMGNTELISSSPVLECVPFCFTY